WRASFLAVSFLPSSTPMVACCMSKKPPRTSTNTEARNTVKTTRRGKDRHHQLTGNRHQRDLRTLGIETMCRRSRQSDRNPAGALSDLNCLAGLVADPSYGHHDLGMLRIPLDLGPQPLYMDVHQSRIGGVAVAPDLLQQDFPAEHLPWPPGQGE